jgi:hypothetical protein
MARERELKTSTFRQKPKKYLLAGIAHSGLHYHCFRKEA